MKKGKGLGILLSIILLIVMSTGVIAAYSDIYQRAQEQKSNTYETESFLEQLTKSSHSFYWKLQQQNSDKQLAPLDVFWPDYKPPADTSQGTAAYGGSAATYELGYQDDNYEYAYEVDSYRKINGWIKDWYYNTTGTYGHYYWAMDNTTGNTLSNFKPSISRDIEATGQLANTDSRYKYWIKLVYDKDGELEIQSLYGASPESQEGLRNSGLEDILYTSPGFGSLNYNGKLQKPVDMTMIYAIDTDSQDWYSYWQNRSDFLNAGFAILYLTAIAGALFLGMLLPLIKPLRLGKGISLVLPLELCALGLAFLIPMGDVATDMAITTMDGRFYEELISNSFVPATARTMVFGCNVIYWFFLLGAVYVIGLSLRQIFTLGLKQYLLKKCWCIRFAAFIVHGIRNMFTALGDVDLSERSNKTLSKVVFANFLVLTLICCFWFFGVFGLAFYSILLFLLLKSRLDEAKSAYQKMMSQIIQMKNGRMNIRISEDLGIFEPMKEELNGLADGLELAVERETQE